MRRLVINFSCIKERALFHTRRMRDNEWRVKMEQQLAKNRAARMRATELFTAFNHYWLDCTHTTWHSC
uniref:Uncharacterized protein n=1 Tax=Trichuris muris TaxID=70415 RepID=A0A5S6Q2T1_TRIMR